MAKVTQRDNTRNQSTVDITHSHVFMGNNRYQTASGILNDAEEDITLVSGMLVKSSTALGTQIAPFKEGDDIDALLGVLIMDGDADLANTATLADVNYAIGGNVDETQLVTAEGDVIDADSFVSLSTVTYRHALQKLGFHLNAVVNNNKLDN